MVAYDVSARVEARASLLLDANGHVRQAGVAKQVRESYAYGLRICARWPSTSDQIRGDSGRLGTMAQSAASTVMLQG